MLNVKVISQNDDTFPLTEYPCSKCNHIHRYFSVPHKECIICGEKFPNIRSIIEKLAYRKEHYNLKLDIKHVNNTSGG